MKEFNLNPEIAAHLDTFSPSISNRAAEVWDKIPKEAKDTITIYDLSCFCLEFLSLQAQNEMQYLLPTTKEVAKVFYYSHYLRIWLNHIGDIDGGTQAVADGKEGERSDIQSAAGTISEAHIEPEAGTSPD